MKVRSFTLFETLVVMIIIGVLATLAVRHYQGIADTQVDREAQVNIRMIAAAERAVRMDSANLSFNLYTGAQPATTVAINAGLRLSIPAGNNRNWNYSVLARPAGGPPYTTFCVEARRIRNGVLDARWWSMTNAENDPANLACVAPRW